MPSSPHDSPERGEVVVQSADVVHGHARFDSTQTSGIVKDDLKTLRRPRTAIDYTRTSQTPMSISKQESAIGRTYNDSFWKTIHDSTKQLHAENGRAQNVTHKNLNCTSIPNHCTNEDSFTNDATMSADASCVASLFEDEDFLEQQRELMSFYCSASNGSNTSRDHCAHEDQEDCGSHRGDLTSATASSTAASHQDGSSSSSDDGFLDYMKDPEFLREQQEVMAQIIAQQQKASSQENDGERKLKQVDESSTAAQAPAEILSNAAQEAVRLCREDGKKSPPPSSPHKRKSPKLDKKLSPKPRASFGKTCTASKDRKNSSHRPTTGEKEVDLSNGKKLRIRGTDHTWRQIAKGGATVVQCPGCYTYLQVGAKAKLVYCTSCGNVTPVDITMTATARTNNTTMDSPLAAAMQSQEMEIALAKKMAKEDKRSRKKT